MRWLILAALLLAAPVSAGTFTLASPHVGKVVCYGDSLCNSIVTDWLHVLADAGMTVGDAGVAGAHADLASSATNSVEAQAINAAGCPSDQLDLFGEGLIDTCIADIDWQPNDFIVIQVGTNDVGAGSASVWDSGGNGATYQTALENILTEAATVSAQCILILPVPRGDFIDSDGAPDQAKYDLMDTALKDRQIAAVAAAGSTCQIVDTYRVFESYRVEHGDDAMFDLMDAANVHPSSVPGALGDSGTVMVGEHIRGAIYSMLGSSWECNPFGLFGCELSPQTAGFPNIGLNINETFDLNPMANGWTDQTGNITHGTGAITSSDTNMAILTKDSNSPNADPLLCVLGGTLLNSGQDFMGCARGVDVNDYANSQHLAVIMAGGGHVRVYEMTGNTIDEDLCSTDDDGNDSCADAGNVDPDTCVAFQIEGEGTSLVVRTWVTAGENVPCDTHYPDKTDPHTWGTCISGVFASGASSPGCSLNNCELATGVDCFGGATTADPSGTYNDSSGVAVVFDRDADGEVTQAWISNDLTDPLPVASADLYDLSPYETELALLTGNGGTQAAFAVEPTTPTTDSTIADCTELAGYLNGDTLQNVKLELTASTTYACGIGDLSIGGQHIWIEIPNTTTITGDFGLTSTASHIKITGGQLGTSVDETTINGNGGDDILFDNVVVFGGIDDGIADANQRWTFINSEITSSGWCWIWNGNLTPTNHTDVIVANVLFECNNSANPESFGHFRTQMHDRVLFLDNYVSIPDQAADQDAPGDMTVPFRLHGDITDALAAGNQYDFKDLDSGQMVAFANVGKNSITDGTRTNIYITKNLLYFDSDNQTASSSAEIRRGQDGGLDTMTDFYAWDNDAWSGEPRSPGSPDFNCLSEGGLPDPEEVCDPGDTWVANPSFADNTWTDFDTISRVFPAWGGTGADH